MTASLLDVKIIADVVSSNMEDDDPLEDHRPHPHFAEALSVTDVLHRYCADIQESRFELFKIISCVGNTIRDVAKHTMQTKITACCK